MKRQSQINDSKQRIAKAMIELLRRDDFKVITLSEIAAYAGVTRMTLHRHFKTKENIILYMAQKSFEEHIKENNDSKNPLLELLFTRLEALKNLPHRRILLESNELNSLFELFRFNMYRDGLQQRLTPELAEDPYFYSFYFGGLGAVIRSWLEEDCVTPTQVLVHKIASYSSRFIKQ